MLVLQTIRYLSQIFIKMDILVTLIASFCLLLFNAIKGYFIAYPLLFTLGLISFTLYRRGFSTQALMKMGLTGSKKALPVLYILLLIGAVISVWMAAGTVPAIVYYGIQLISPSWFILSAFILTSLVSLLIGTSFGAASTIGVALMMMSRGSDVNSHWVAGAIIAGAYFGDRCSPMSSSAHLVATITRTNLYVNLKNMMATGLLPFGISCLLYFSFSLLHPVQLTNSNLIEALDRVFNLHYITLLPALVILVLAIFRADVKLSMLASIAVGMTLAIAIQHYSLLQVLSFAITGFQLEENRQGNDALQAILLGGGMGAMAKVCIVVCISTAISGILSGTRALQPLEAQLQQVKSRASLFGSTACIGLASAAFGCTQTIAILLTQQLVERRYHNWAKGDQANDSLALDLENTVIVLAPLIPWNIAGLVPATILMTDWGFIPYAFYLYLIPLLNYVQLRTKSNSFVSILKG